MTQPRPVPRRLAAMLAPMFALAFGIVPAAASPETGWELVMDGGAFEADRGVTALTDAAGNVVLAAEVTDRFHNGNLLVTKLSRETGDTIWSRSILGSPDKGVVVGGMVWDHAGHLLIGGTRLGCFG
jgi:hypothetical protein